MSSKDIEKVVIVIPTYNEAMVIEDTVDKLNKCIDLIEGFDIEILIFDSASTDRTTDCIKNLQNKYNNVCFCSEESKTGLGIAYHKAMRYAMDILQADIVFEYDADGSHQAKYIEPMLNRIQKADVVVGSRYAPGGSIPSNWGAKRKLLSNLGNMITRLVLSPKHKDYTSGFRATRTRVLREIWPNKFLSSGYAYKLHLYWLLHKYTSRIIEFPIQFIDREKGFSKLPANSIGDSLRVIFTLRLNQTHRYLRMCGVGAIGAALQFSVYNLMRLFLPPVLSIQIAIILAILLNFMLNNKVTFKETLRESSLISGSAFFGFSLLMVFLQSLWLDFAVSYFGGGVLRENAVIMIGLIIGSFMNYFFYSKIIWRNKNNALSDKINI